MSIQLDLDHPALFRELDAGNMLDWIDGMPAQLEDGYRAGLFLPLPAQKPARGIVLTGVGDSIIAADLFTAYAAPSCPLPVIVHRDYDLPGWARGADVLVVAMSLSGNAEETISVVEAAHRNGCQVIVLARGGRLVEWTGKNGQPFWLIDFTGPSSAASGWFFGMLLALFFRLGLLADPAGELMATVEALQAQQAQISAEVPTRQNSAKRLAGQVVGRWVSVFGADLLAPVARRWKEQINQLAKALAIFEQLPEADYNSVEGVSNPPDLVPKAYDIFLQGVQGIQRNQLRSQITQRAMMLEGIPTDIISARGPSRMEQMWTALHYGDYFAYYLAMIYGVDPIVQDRILGIQDELSG